MEDFLGPLDTKLEIAGVGPLKHVGANNCKHKQEISETVGSSPDFLLESQG